MRLASSETVADLRGPTACEVLDPAEAAVAVARLGPDPASTDDLAAAGEVMVQRLTSRNVAVGQLLMDQSVVAGIGNIYRAELLFRARLDPHTPGRRVPAEVARALWDDWAVLLADGIRDGFILTREDLTPAQREEAADRLVAAALGLPPHRAPVPGQRHPGGRRGDGHPQALLVPGLPGVSRPSAPNSSSRPRSSVAADDLGAD